MRKYNILLVDDEEPALQGLEQGIDWERIQIGKMYKCHSRDTAIRMMKTYQIDIVVTDIEMPNGSGLELIRWVRENYPQTVAVFYTGHADFSYAQEALRLGAADYLLKPIAYPQMEEILLREEKKLAALEKNAGIMQDSDEITDSSPAEIVETVKKLIAENLSQGNLQREELASQVHISPGYLTRLFKKETGVSLTDYIIDRRIAVAKKLLVKTNLPVTAVADRVGISYASYFTKIFKEKTGMTPQEYKQMNK